jgi:hypothetical protein
MESWIRPAFAAFVVGFAAVLAGCGGGSSAPSSAPATTPPPPSSAPATTGHSSEYPAAERSSFIRSCTATSGGQADYCKLALKCIEHRVSHDDFVTYDQNVIQGNAQDPRVKRVFDECAHGAIQKAALVPRKRYLSSEKASFLHSCNATSGGQKQYCRYAYQCVVQRVSHKDFVRFSLNIIAGRAQDPKTLDAIKGCSRSAAQRAGIALPQS